MKVLSDNTAARLLRHLDAAEGGITPRRIPRGASTTPPAPMWQIHVAQDGAVTVDGGDVYAGGQRHTLGQTDLGTATGSSLVVWQDGEDGGTLTLESSSWQPEEGASYRIIGEVVRGEGTSAWFSKQYVHGPIEADGNHFGDAENAESASTWNQSDETPAILEITGETKCKVLVDRRGNIISWTSSEDGEVPDTPTPPTPPPTCGNPLNDPVSDNPLDDPAAGGGGDGDDDTGNPLDSEGDGGYTPACSP